MTLWGFLFLCFVVAGPLVFWRLRVERERKQPSSCATAEPSRREQLTYSTASTASEIEVERGIGGSFLVHSANGSRVHLSESVAVQVHRWLAPMKACQCTCFRDEAILRGLGERSQHFEIYTDDSSSVGRLTVLRVEDGTAITFDRSAADKLHFLLRPQACRCGCLIDGVGIRVVADRR